jgi:DNA-binding transcriptional ArsR family regulator
MTNYSMSLDRVFWALGDPTRFAIVEHLSQGSSSVSELAEPFQMALPTFLQHLGVLEKHGLVTTKKVGRVRTCTLNAARIDQARRWLEIQEKQWAVRLDALDKLLENKS